MRIALVNDVRMALEALRRIVQSLPDAQIAWTAEDGREALAKCQADTPDLILMDMIMPIMDGVEATRQIMQQCPCPIVVVTATVEGNAARVYAALGHGALDAVNTPVLGLDGRVAGAEALIRKIRAVWLLTRPSVSLPSSGAAPLAPPWPAGRAQIADLVAIGASTGGPQALATLLGALPRPPCAALVVIQHVDPAFAPGLAHWLAEETGHRVLIAAEGQAVERGAVLIAATADHLVLDPDGRLRYRREPAAQPYRPSVDVFFESLLRAPVHPSVALLLTGMGRDGAAGLLALRRAGWHTLAQDKASSVVWGMPGMAVQLGAAERVLPIAEIAPAIGKWLERPTRGTDRTEEST